MLSVLLSLSKYLQEYSVVMMAMSKTNKYFYTTWQLTFDGNRSSCHLLELYLWAGHYVRSLYSLTNLALIKEDYHF